MHNDIMALGLKERPPMLAPGPYELGQITIIAAQAEEETYALKCQVVEETYENTGDRYENQRVNTVAGGRETVRQQAVQQSGIQCFNYKGLGHFAKECRSSKQVKDSAYHKEKMLLYK
nr:hypothetical protein [Tanacetum cinerariifolium]